MNIPWRDDDHFDTASTAGEGQVTILDRFCFAISARNGDIRPERAMGLFVADTRYLARCELRINDAIADVVDAETPTPFSAIHRLMVPVADAEGTITRVGVERRRYVGNGMREDVILRSAAARPIDIHLSLLLGTDFADPFSVRQSIANGHSDTVTAHADQTNLNFRGSFAGSTLGSHSVHRSTRVTCSRPVVFHDDGLHVSFALDPDTQWLISVQVTPVLDGHELAPDHPLALPIDQSAPAIRLARWQDETTALSAKHDPLVDLVSRSSADLAALRLPDPDAPGRHVIAAGAPWYMTLFGRDSLLTAYAALPVSPDLAHGVLHALGRLQGKGENPDTEEQPGRILHEVRSSTSSGLSLDNAYRYFGTVDASPLYVMLLGEACRWGMDLNEVQELLRYADRCLEWCEQYGDSDGDGYLEYERSGSSGLLNQGWKDSSGCIRFADGTTASGSITLCEAQAYLYGAYLSRADLAGYFGDEFTAQRYRSKAAELKVRFNNDFWDEERGWFALGLDGQKRRIDSLTSNIGHCLWTGIVDDDKAARIASLLLSPEMFSGWGVRTMASSMGAYDPMTYHNGAIWPHDNAIVAAGLMRYGFIEETQRIVAAVVDAGDAFGGRLPEIYGGQTRVAGLRPVEYPTTCSPQAWAAATPWWMVRTLLRLDVSVADRTIWCAPALPESFGDLRLMKVALGNTRFTIEVIDGKVSLNDLPEGFSLVSSTRTAGNTPIPDAA